MLLRFLPHMVRLPSMQAAATLRRPSLSATSLDEARRPAKLSRHDYSDFVFVTFFATGEQGDNGHTCAANQVSRWCMHTQCMIYQPSRRS